MTDAKPKAKDEKTDVQKGEKNPGKPRLRFSRFKGLIASLALATAVGVAAPQTGCSGEDTAPPTIPADGGHDGGDGGTVVDGGTGGDGGTVVDGGTGGDGGTVVDGGTGGDGGDGGFADGGTGGDGGFADGGSGGDGGAATCSGVVAASVYSTGFYVGTPKTVGGYVFDNQGEVTGGIEMNILCGDNNAVVDTSVFVAEGGPETVVDVLADGMMIRMLNISSNPGGANMNVTVEALLP